jgi:sulfate permease, SulP family
VILNGMQPRVVLLGRIPGRMGFYKLHRSPEARPIAGMTIAFIQGSLLFFNAEFVKVRLREIIAETAADTRWFVIDASAISQLDSTGAEMLAAIGQDLQRRGIRLGFAEVQFDVAGLLARAHVSDAVGGILFFDDLDDVDRAFARTTEKSAEEQTDTARAFNGSTA